MGRLVAGVDSSTQSTTVVVLDADTGARVSTGKAPHEVTGTGGARESDPRGWWQALRDALAETGQARDIAAISIGAQQHGLVVLDAAGEPLRPAVLWNDTRSGTPDGPPGARAGCSGLGATDRVGAGAIVHPDPMGLAARDRARGGGRDEGHPPAARLPDRAPER